MSYILDALQRLEQDKKKSRKSDDPVQAVLHFNPEIGVLSGRSPRRPWFWILSATGLALLVAIGITFWVARKTAPAPVVSQETVRSGKPLRTALLTAPRQRVAPQRKRKPARRAVRSSGLQKGSTGVSRKRSSSPRVFPVVSPPASPSRKPMEQTAWAPISEPDEWEDVPAPYIAPTEEKKSPALVEVTRPTRPVAKAPYIRTLGSETGLRISAIVWCADREKRFALVNLKTVYPGDRIAGRTVVDILEDAVVFEEGGERYQVRMGSR